MRRPWSSKTSSPARCVSKASAYWKPEQPPPRTPTRRPEVWMSALWAARNSWTFSAPLSVNVIKLLAPVLAESNASRSVAAATLFRMPSTDELRQRIETAIPGASADVQDLTGGGDHFRATVIAPGFADLSRIEQHRAVYAVFGAEIGGPIHALSLETRAE